MTDPGSSGSGGGVGGGRRDRDGVYVIPGLDRSGLLFGFGLGEVVVLGVVATVCFVLLQAGVPAWGYGGLLAGAAVLCRRRWPGGLQLLEYWPILRCRLERARSGGRWQAGSSWTGVRGDLPRSLAGAELVSVTAAGLGPVGVVVDRVAATATFVVELGSGSFLLASPVEQARTLERWGRLLGSAVETGRSGVRHVAATVVSSQGSVRDHRAFLAEVSPGAGVGAAGRAARDYGRLIDLGAATSSSHQILFSVTVAARARR